MRHKKTQLMLLTIVTVVLVITTVILIAWKVGVLFQKKDNSRPVTSDPDLFTRVDENQDEVMYRTASGGKTSGEGLQKIYRKADNYGDLGADLVWSFPAFTVRNIEQRDAFLLLLDQNMEFIENNSEDLSIKEFLSGLDEAFFQKRDLVVVLHSLGPGKSYRLEFGRVGAGGPYGDSEVWSVTFLQSMEPDAFYREQKNVFWIFSLEKGILDNYSHGVAAYSDGLIH